MTTRLYTTGIAALLLVSMAGCDLVYDLERPPEEAPSDGQMPYERCGPFLYDEPLRYAMITNPNAEGESGITKAWAWSEARTACRQRGMDLAVFNDERELGGVPAEVQWPFWMGASRSSSAWTTVDECPGMMPTNATADTCGIVPGPNTVSATSCTGDMKNTKPDEPPFVVAALCETPRPEAGPCLGNDPTKTEYVMSPTALSFAAARTFCADRGGRPVVFETHAEWVAVGKRIDEELHERFWVGSTFDGVEWKTENKCPAHYSWASGSPSEPPHTGDCLGSMMLEVNDDDGFHTVITGVDRLECSAAEMRALCEI